MWLDSLYQHRPATRDLVLNSLQTLHTGKGRSNKSPAEALSTVPGQDQVAINSATHLHIFLSMHTAPPYYEATVWRSLRRIVLPNIVPKQ